MLRLKNWAVLFLASAALTGCHGNAPSANVSQVAFQLDWYPQPEQGGFYEAQIKGYYAQEGLEVTIQPGGPYAVAEQQVSTGNAQFAMGSSDRLLEADSQGQSLVAVGATMQHDPQALMLHASSPVQNFADLEGHTVALKPGSTWFEYLVARYKLKNVRETPATYSVANFLQDPNYIQQIFVTSEPYFARKAGAQVRTLLISDTGYDPYRVFFTRRDFLAEHPDVVAKFVRASLRGWQDYIADPSEVNAALLKLNPALSADQMQFTAGALRDGHFIYPEGDPGKAGAFDATRWQEMYRQLSELGLIKHPIDPSTAYTTQFSGQISPQKNPKS
jgi:NitT/TauT family transport system substrate-binding protein